MSPESFKVCHQGRKATVSPYTRQADGVACWRFGYKDGTGRWHYVTRMTREEARQAALAKLEELHPHGIDWPTLPADEREFFASLHRLGLSSGDREAVLKFAGALSAPSPGSPAPCGSVHPG